MCYNAFSKFPPKTVAYIAYAKDRDWNLPLSSSGSQSHSGVSLKASFLLQTCGPP